MFESWDDGGLSDTKEQILAAGGVKVSKGVFRLPDGSLVSPDSGTALTPIPGTSVITATCDQIKARGGVTPAEAARCGWGYSGIYSGPTPTQGLPKMDTGGTTGKPTGETGMETAPPAASGGGGFDMGFLSQPVFGIPLWIIAAGVGAVLLLKKR